MQIIGQQLLTVKDNLQKRKIAIELRTKGSERNCPSEGRRREINQNIK